MRNKYNLLFFGLAVLLFQACAGIYSVVEFEVLEPATVSLPEDVERIIVMNRAPLTLESFDSEDVDGLEHTHLLVLDTLIVKSLQRGLLTVFRDSPVDRFQYPIWLDDRRKDTARLEALLLTRREVDDICSVNGGDAILSMEYYRMGYEEHGQSFSDSYIAGTKYYEVSSEVYWVVYLPGTPRYFDDYKVIDTLYFTEVMDGEFIRYYSASQLLTESFYKSGRKYGQYLVPVWNNTSRNIYKGKGEELRKASKLTSKGDWDSAYNIWDTLSRQDDNSSAARALYNMAIYHELEDQLQEASRFANEAYKRDTLELIRSYKEEIDTRLMNQEELYKQVR